LFLNFFYFSFDNQEEGGDRDSVVEGKVREVDKEEASFLFIFVFVLVFWFLFLAFSRWSLEERIITFNHRI
jgi:hypothetical protein